MLNMTLIGELNPWSTKLACPDQIWDEDGWHQINTKKARKYGNGDLVSKAIYIDACDDGSISDQDGHGIPVNAEAIENCHATNEGKDLPEGTTHIVWFNK